jgi:hypothetical protein
MRILGQEIDVFPKLKWYIASKSYLFLMNLIINLVIINNPVSVNSKNLNSYNSEYVIHRALENTSSFSPTNKPHSYLNSTSILSSDYAGEDSAVFVDSLNVSRATTWRAVPQNTTRQSRRGRRTTTTTVATDQSEAKNNTSSFYIIVFVLMFFMVLLVIVGRVIYSANDVSVNNAYLKYHRNSVAIAAVNQTND